MKDPFEIKGYMGEGHWGSFPVDEDTKLGVK